ncbi:MAG: uroporphyrinogen-III synthase [Desulfobacterota bacterium]|nr:uroporphyrinogen-III synthase [Thermodesulfobacteriota bacterium]
MENKPFIPPNNLLDGKKILITRPKEQISDLFELLKACGAIPISFPTIQIVPPLDWEKVDQAIENLSAYDVIIFTSVNGVKKFFQRLQENRKDKDSINWKNLQICAIGPKTASELKKLGLTVDIIPPQYQAESVLEILAKNGINGKHFLLPRAEEAREILTEGIKKFGGHIEVVPVYRTVKAEANPLTVKELFKQNLIDIITFTSSSTVKNFVSFFTEDEITQILQGVVVASIGPITAQAAFQLGIKSDIIAEKYTIPGLVKAIVKYFHPKLSEI